MLDENIANTSETSASAIDCCTGNFENIPQRDRIIVALDCPEAQALKIAKTLKGCAKWVKIGMTTYYAAGPRIVQACKELGFNVFLDLKFFDIPHQVEGAAYSATLSGADMITMHASGGTDMMRAAVKGANAARKGSNNNILPITLGITVLTSMNANTLEQIGVSSDLNTQVKSLATLALSSGLSGVVCSAQEAAMLRTQLGQNAYIVTPGIRPTGADAGDQSRITTPIQAFKNGSSHIVIGRPITQASDPRAAFEEIANTLNN